MNNKKVRQLIVWVLLFVSVAVLIRIAPSLIKPQNLQGDDFFHLWAAGNLNLQGQNPYDPQTIDQLRIESGSIPSEATIPVMLNPPWSILLLLPFGLMTYPISRFAWMIFSIVLLLLSALILWRIYSGSPKLRWISILLVFIFAPTISVLEKGQITPIVIFGIIGFVYFSSFHQNDWLAGVFLALSSVKPQVALIFWIAVLFWVIFQRRWQIIFGFIVSISVMTAVASIFNHKLILQYIELLRTYHFSDWATPTIGAYLRLFWLGTEKFWLQLLPTVLGVFWFIYYWQKHKHSWNWLFITPVLLFVSQLTAPYNWSYDMVILIPAIILAAIWITADWKNWKTVIMIVVFLGISALDLILHMKLNDFWFIWVTPVLLIWFLIIRWNYETSQNLPSVTGT
jgi:hypothetical protein